MTRDEIYAAVKDYANRPDLSNTTLTTLLAVVQSRLSRALSDHPRNRAQTDVTVSAGSSMLTYPADMIRLVSLTGPDGIYAPMVLRSNNKAKSQFIDYGTWAFVIPQPSEDTDVTVDYYAALDALSGGSSSNWLSTYFPDVYIWGLLAEVAEWLKNSEHRMAWNTKYAAALDEVIDQGWNQNLGDFNKVV